jgi:phosphocarrier protein
VIRRGGRRSPLPSQPAGLHAGGGEVRQLASKFKAEIKVIKDGTRVNGKSIMGLLTLVAALGWRS